MKEGVINKKIQDYIKAQGGYVIKTIATNRAGVPDIIACINGKFIGIEGKTATGVVSKLQEHHLKLIKEAGGITIVARSVEDVKQHLARLKTLPNHNKHEHQSLCTL